MLYLTINVSANMPPPIIYIDPPEIPTKGDDTPAEEATKPSMAPDSGGPVQSTAPERLLPSPDPLPAETGTPMPEIQAEMSQALIAVRRADEAKKPIDRANTWKGTVGRIKWVMDTVSEVVEVRTISILPLLY